MYYLNNLQDLAPAISERLNQQNVIREKIDSWVYQEYGILNFSQLAREYFGFKDNTTNLVLLRQMPSVRVEDIACHIGAKILGYGFKTYPFLDDTFSPQNHEKRSYLNPVWYGHGRNGPYVQGQKLVSGDLGNYVGKTLGSIESDQKIPGNFLHEFHFELRSKLFGKHDLIDVSELHRTTVRQASIPPNELYSFCSGISQRVDFPKVDLSSSTFRPPSEWYYPLMFSWFLDGSAVLLETYDNELAQVSLAKELFEKTVQKVLDGTGFTPLVLKVPPLDKNMLYLAKTILENPHALNELEERFSGRTTGDSVQFFSEIAHAVLAWRKN